MPAEPRALPLNLLRMPWPLSRAPALTSTSAASTGGTSGPRASRWLLAAMVIVSGLSTGADPSGIHGAARRAALTEMTSDEAARVLRNRERLALLPTAEQAKLRSLADEIDRDPERDRLRHIMARYYNWLKKLGPVQRAELLELPAAERLAKIKQLRSEQQSRVVAESTGGEPLSEADLENVMKWIENHAWENRAAVLAALKPDRRAQFEQLDPSKQRRALMVIVSQRWRSGKTGALGAMTLHDVHNLIEKLSPAAQERFKQASGVVEQRQLLRQWGQIAVRHRLETAISNRKNADYTEEELNHFFEHDLSAEQRERLLALPPDRMQRELRRLYFDERQRLEDLPGAADAVGTPGAESTPPAETAPPTNADKPAASDKPSAGDKPGKGKRHLRDAGKSPDSKAPPATGRESKDGSPDAAAEPPGGE